jgi:hypothetical protein
MLDLTIQARIFCPLVYPQDLWILPHEARLDGLAQARDAQTANTLQQPCCLARRMHCILQPPEQRGCPSKAVDSKFRTISWNQRSKMLEHVADYKFFAQYCCCVFSNRNKPGSAELLVEMDLSLEELRRQGQGRDTFPPRTLFVLQSSLQWDIFCLGDVFAISMGLPRLP